MNSDTKLERVIFSIDNADDTHQMAKFLRYVDTLNAEGRLYAPVTLCIGKWGDELEPSFMMYYSDFEKYVVPSGYVDGQACWIKVPGDVRQPCSVVWSLFVLPTDPTDLGPMREVTAEEALQSEGFTYVISTGRYFVC